jgi:prepilin peptidase CpaA
MIWAFWTIIVLAVAYDLARREIPDWIPVLLGAAAVVATVTGLTTTGWTALVVGCALGLLLSGLFFALGGLGGGDVKLIAALGAALGPIALVHSLLWIAVSGGILAVIAGLRGKRDFAYAPAIAAGVLVHILRSGA